MALRRDLLMTRPSAYEVSYIINPWMQPRQWQRSPENLRQRALAGWQQLYDSLQANRVTIHLQEAVKGLPDLVFPANAAVVLDRRVLLSRFAYPQRQPEEPVFQALFQRLCGDGIVEAVESLPPGIVQEGAGDCLWDARRGLFWAGYGQRSQREAIAVIADYFGCEVQPLELADPRFYHLDVALAVLEHGELLYYPAAFSADSLATIRERVPAAQRLELLASEASNFCANIISINGCLTMTPPGDRLRRLLVERDYRVLEIDLSPFLLSGGAAACLTLRLDYCRNPEPVANPTESQHE